MKISWVYLIAEGIVIAILAVLYAFGALPLKLLLGLAVALLVAFLLGFLFFWKTETTIADRGIISNAIALLSLSIMFGCGTIYLLFGLLTGYFSFTSIPMLAVPGFLSIYLFHLGKKLMRTRHKAGGE